VTESSWPPLRLPALAAGLAAGIAASAWCGPLAAAPTVWWLALLALAPVAPWRRAASWLGAVVLAGAALAASARAHAPVLPVGAVADDRGDDELVGLVDGPVQATRWGRGLRLAVDGPDGGDARVWVSVDGDTAALPGDRVRVVGRLRTPRGYRDPGSPDRAVLAARRGVDLELRGPVTIVEAGAAFTPWRWASAAQRRSSAWVARRGGDPVGNAVVRGAVLGDRSAIDPAVDAAWRAAGVYHVLSVSGLHLAVVALLAFAVARRVLAAAGAVQPVRVAAIAAALIAIAYTAITGAEIATVRALVVALVALGGAAVSRRARALDALGLAALIVLAGTPALLADASFQLSFAATAALLVHRRSPAAIEPVPPWPRRVVRAIGRWLMQALAASLWVTLVTAPITAYHFHELAVGGVVGNLVATPIIELAVIPLALAGVALAAVSTSVGGALVDVAIAICGAVHLAIAWLATWTPVVSVPPPRPVEVGALVGLGAAWLGRGRVRRAHVVLAVAVAAAALAASVAWPRASDDLRITFLDVGQGDAAVIEAPGGAVWLIDAGGVPYAPPGDDALAIASAPGEAIARFLATRRIDRIDVALVSHPHPDHYLGLVALARRVPIGELWTAAPAPGTAPPPAGRVPTFDAIARELAASGTRLVHPPLGRARSSGDAHLHVLAPVHDPGAGALPHAACDPVRSVNDDSLVVAVERAGRRVLFLGDVELEGEDRLVASTPDLAADVVKVAHHGSPTSSSPALVAATHPSFAIVSCGLGNRFRFPAPDVVARWTEVGATVVRTDQAGAITVTIARDGALDVSTVD
jgi:competence protein ComEC